MADYEFLKLEREGPLTIITINRPEVYNALHPPAHWEFDKVFTEFRDDPDQWIAILTGAGDKAFTRRQRPEIPGGGHRLAPSPRIGFCRYFRSL